MAAKVVVYTQAGCSTCDQVTEFLTRNGIAFEKRDVRADPEALETLLERGFRATPVTFVDGEPIAGYDPEALLRAVTESA